MWQTGRTADRNSEPRSLEPAAPRRDTLPTLEPAAPRKDALPTLEPAAPDFADRMRDIGVAVGRASRWVLLLLALALGGLVLVQSADLQAIRVPGSDLTWLKATAILAAVAVALRSRGRATMGLRALRGGGARAHMDPFARLAADTRAEKSRTTPEPGKQCA